jgi:uncharacterized protein
MFQFNPPAFYRNRHLQTIVSPLTRRTYLPHANELVRLPISERVYLEGKLWRAENTKMLVLIYHGLGGFEDSPYVVGAANALRKAGFSTLRMRLRGAEREAPAVPAIYHAGLTEDLPRAVEWARNAGYEKIFLVGFSLSGNTILKWLGEGKRGITAAFVVSPPVRIAKCAAAIDAPGNRLYRNYFMKKLRGGIQLKSIEYPDLFSKYLHPKIYTCFRNFDEAVTAQLGGFAGADDYYENASSYRTLSHIENQVAIVHATDDPFVDSVDLAQWEKTPDHISLKLFRLGGHVGFYEGPFRGYCVDRWVVDYFSQVA